MTPLHRLQSGPAEIVRHEAGGRTETAGLLVILSDGKPEDYDEYKGDCAVEDARAVARLPLRVPEIYRALTT